MDRSCPICKGDVIGDEDTVVLREKGSAGIDKASQERNDTLEVHSGDTVHKTRRQTYANKILIRLHLQNSQNNKESSDVIWVYALQKELLT